MVQTNDNYRYEPFANETFRHMPSADGVSTMIASNYLLGDVSGKIEWTQQPDKARDTFIHLSAYEHFIDERQLLLLGRTGSGKSAIIYGLKDDIQNGIIDNYSDVIQIDEKEFCEKLAEMCYGIDINRFDATNKIMSAVVMAIYTKVMLYCCETFKDDRKELRYTTKYLLSNKFITVKAKNLSDILAQLSSDDYEQHIKALYDNNVISTAFGVARLLSKTREIITADDDIAGNINDYKKALDELTAFLASSNKKVLVQSVEKVCLSADFFEEME